MTKSNNKWVWTAIFGLTLISCLESWGRVDVQQGILEAVHQIQIDTKEENKSKIFLDQWNIVRQDWVLRNEIMPACLIGSKTR